MKTPPHNRVPQASLPARSAGIPACSRAVTILLLLVAVLAKVAVADTWHWVSRPIPLDREAPLDAELVVQNAAGAEIARSRDCRILSQAGRHWIAGRVRLPPDGGPFDLALEASSGTDAFARIPLDEAVFSAPPSYDVVLLLDASHSMRNNDPRDLRKRATTAFWSLASSSARIRRLSLVRFRKDARLLIPPTPPAKIDSLDAALDQLRPYSSTDFGPPFAEAARLLRDAPGGRAVLFLSDGEPREDYADTHRDLAAIDAPVYTIGLSEEADGDLLTRIATETNGQYFEAPTADQLGQIFHQIFRILSDPRTVAEYGEYAGAGTFVVDTEMANPFLTLAVKGGGKGGVSLDQHPLPGISAGGIYERDLSDLGFGPHTIEASGDLRASWTVRAETAVGIAPFALNRTAPRGTDLVFGGFVRGLETVDHPKLTGTLRTPDGKRRELTLESTPFGLHTARISAPEAGRYTVALVLSARRGEQQVLRRRELDFVRTAAGAPATVQTADALPVELSRTLADTASAPVRIRVDAHPLLTETGLQTTVWSDPSSLVLDPFPGTEQTKTLHVRLNSDAAGAHPITAVAESADPGIALRVEGTPQLNRTTTLKVTAHADERSAGSVVDGRLILSHGTRSWSVPIGGRVRVPTLNAALDTGQFQTDGGDLVRHGTLTVSVSPEGRCDIRIGPENAPWQASAESATVGTTPLELPLTFRVPRPDEHTQWRGQITIGGPGLEPVAVPWNMAWRPSTTAADSGLTGPGIPASPRFPWAWVVWGIVALLVFLLAMTIRGSQRAAFLLVSAIIHLIVLFFTLPESTLEEIAESATMKPQTVAVGKAVQEEQIAAETTRAQSEHAAPAEDERDKTETAPEQEVNDESEDLDAPAKPAETPDADDPHKLHEDAEKQTQETEDLKPETAEPVRKRREDAQTPEPNAAEDQRAPEATTVDLRDVSRQAPQPRAAPEKPTPDTPVNTLHTRVRKSAPETEDVRSETSDPTPRKRAARIQLGGPASASETTQPVHSDGGHPADSARQALTGATADIRTQIAIGVTARNMAGDLAKRRVEVGDAVPAPTDAAVPRKSAASTGSDSAPQADPDGSPAVALTSAVDPGADQPVHDVPTGPAAQVHAPAPALVPLPTVAKSATQPPTITRTNPDRAQQAKPAKRSAEGPASEANPLDGGAATGPSLVQPTGEGGDADRGGFVAAIRRDARSTVPTAPTPSPVAGPTTRRTRQRPADLTNAANPQDAPEKRRSQAVEEGDNEPAEGEDGAQRVDTTVQRPPPAEPRPARTFTITPPRRAPLIAGGELADQPSIGRKSTAGSSTQSRWRRTFPNFKHSGDWDCDRTAMLNLAHQVEQRTGSILPFESRNVSVEDENLHKAPFLFMSGHNDFVFSDREVEFLRSYLKKGGALWINDSTDVDNETFDRAVRRELARVLPGERMREIPLDHAIFQAPYDLSNGFGGFRVPPGDKYRQDYLEGVWLENRLTVVYTRNDYGDGLEIDAHTRALMPSLTDLTQGEMQEASVQMGTNIALHFVQGGDGEDAQLTKRAPPRVKNPADERRKRWANVDANPLNLCTSADDWSKPDGWDGPHYLPVTAHDTGRKGFVGVRFRKGAGEFDGWRAQATVARSVSLTLTDGQVLLLDVINPMKGGARIAVAFMSPNKPYIESAPVFLRPGLNKNVAIDLRQQTFKTEAVNWQNRAAFPDSVTVDRLFILTYPQQPAGALEFGNIRLAKP